MRGRDYRRRLSPLRLGPTVLWLAILLLPTLPSPPTVEAMIAEGAGGGALPDSGGGNPDGGEGGGSPGGNGEDAPEAGGAGEALRDLVERFTNALSMAAEARDRALGELGEAMASLTPREAAELRDALEEAAERSETGSKTLEEVEAAFREAERIDPDRLEQALRAGVLVSDVELMGDPVHPSSGALHHQEREFALPIGDTFFDLSRLHRSDQNLGKRFGSAWFAPFESFAFYSRTRDLDIDESFLGEIGAELRTATSRLEAVAASRFGGLRSPEVRGYYRRVHTQVERALRAGGEAVSFSATALSLTPPFGDSRQAESLLESSRSILARARNLLARYEADRGNGEAMLELLPLLRRQRREVKNALEEIARDREFQQWSDRHSREALSRKVPDQWRRLGGGVIGLIDEEGTLLLYRALRGSRASGLDPLGFVLPGEAAPLGKQTDTLTVLPDGGLLRERRDGTRFRYDPEGRLISQKDRNGQGYTLQRERSRILARGSYGRHITLELAPADGDQVRAVAAPDGAVWRYEYGARGDLLALTGPEGAVYRYRYTSGRGGHRRLSGVTKPDESEVSFFYDSRGRVRALTDEEGRPQEFRYDEGRRTFTFLDRRGGETTLHLSERGLPIQRSSPGGTVWKFFYDEHGRRLLSEGPMGRRERWSYSADGLLLSRTLPTGTTVRYEYDGEGRLLSLSDGPQGAIRYRYDSAGNLVALRGAWGRRSFQHDRLGRPRVMTDALGNRWQYRYDSYGNPAELIQPDGSHRAFVYDLMGRLRSLTDERGSSYRFRYDSLGQLIEARTPDGGVERRRYNRRGDLIIRTAPDGRQWHYSYDRSHRLLEERLPDGRTVNREYDGEGALLAESVNGRQTRSYQRDAEGDIIALHDALLGATVEFTVDPLGRAVEVRGAEGGVTTLSYYPDGTLRSHTSPTGGTTRFDRDRWGRLTQRLDPLGGRWRLRRDEAGRVIAEVSPLGAERRYRYDGEGRIVAVTDEIGGEHRLRRDWRGRVTSHRTPTGATWRYRYDESGRLTESVSPEGRVSSYRYDPLGRLTTIREGEYEPRRLSYDAAGRLTEDRIGEARRQLHYDGAGRLVAIVDPDGASRSYDYDIFDRLRSASTPSGEVRRSAMEDGTERWEGSLRYEINRDRRGLVTRYRDPDGVRLRYRYDSAGLLREITSGGDPVLSIHRDAMGRPLRLLHDDGSSEVRRYDADGRLLLIRHSSGDEKQFRYDSAARVVGIRIGRAPWVTREYDGEGNLLTETLGARGTRRYSYDRDGLMTEARYRGDTLRYTYDGARRLRSVDYAGGEELRIERHYDRGGALTGLSVPSLRITVERKLTPGGRLSSLYLNGVALLELGYDGAGREVSRQIANSGVQRTFYDQTGRQTGTVWQPRGKVPAAGVVYGYTEAGRLAGELLSDGTGKFYRYRSDSLLESTLLLLPQGLSVPYTPAASQHESYSILRRRLRDMLPYQPRATLAGRSWLETSPAGERYAYGSSGYRPTSVTGSVAQNPLGQFHRIALPAATVELGDGPLGRLRRVRSRAPEQEESRSFFYPGPEELYPLVSRSLRAPRRETAAGPVHRHRAGRVVEAERFSPAEGKGPEGSRELWGPGREEWTLLLAAREFPTLYLRFSKDDRSGLNSAGVSRKLSGVVRDLRGSPLWRFDEHTGITQKWLYSSSGSCIIGTVDNEAALGFAAGTNAGPLLRLGYRFYDPATGHFTMADPSGRDLHPTRYAGGDPVNSVDPWGLEQYNMMGFDRQNERLYVQVWDDRRPNRPVRVLNYGATNRVLTPEERDGVPVHYDPDRSTDGDDYYYFPEPFPASPRDGWSVHSPYMSSNPRVGPAIRTDARRRVDSLVPAAGFDSKWKKDSSVIDNGYYLHGGVGNTTWGCIRMADEDMLELQATVENATQSFGNSRLHTLEASNWR